MPIQALVVTRENPVGIASRLLQQENQTMTKSLAVISEAIRNPKHPFRKVDDQPKKAQRHRYERRKVRAYLQIGEWASGEGTA
jgi:hypothetical protein